MVYFKPILHVVIHWSIDPRAQSRVACERGEHCLARREETMETAAADHAATCENAHI